MEGAARPGLLAHWAEGLAGAGPALALRQSAFQGLEMQQEAPFDVRALHLWLAPPGDAPRAAVRLFRAEGAKGLAEAYAAQFYDLAPLLRLAPRFGEVSRLCRAPAAPGQGALGGGPALKAIWRAIHAWQAREGLPHLFGCVSFSGADPARHAPALRALAPSAFLPAPLQPRPAPGATCFRFSDLGAGPAAPTALPPLLRAYLAEGAKISDFAVIDGALDTLHVFALWPFPAPNPGP